MMVRVCHGTRLLHGQPITQAEVDETRQTPSLLYPHYFLSFLIKHKSAAMICHSLNIVKKCVDHLNKGQIPVVAMDQPLFAMAKQMQWNFLDKYGEKQFITMFGGFMLKWLS